MAKTNSITQSGAAKTASKAMRAARPKSNTEKIEELKLGKFSKCEPLCFPEKKAKRGWQIVGAVALMLGAILGVFYLLMTDPIKGMMKSSPMSPGAYLANVDWYWKIAALAVAVAVVCCFTGSVMMFAKKKASVKIWYILIASVLVAVITVSFHRFRLYEQRLCYENYPNIIELGYSCPSVVGELSWIVVQDLMIFGVGILGLWLVHYKTRRCMKRSGSRH